MSANNAFHVAVLAGDGIGPEVMAPALEILRNTSSAGAITSGPMPSPPSTAMWRALLADMGDYLEQR